MISLIILAPIFGIASLFHIYFKKLVSTSIFLAITSIITVIYIFGMFDFLKEGASILFYVGIVSLLYTSYAFREKMLSAGQSVPFIVFIVSSIIYLYLMKDAKLFFWDEYSHWGAFIKDMYFFNDFYGLNTKMAHLNYPPGISIWDYFIVKNTLNSEGNLYYAYFLIIYSSTLMMFEKLNFKQFYWIIPVLLMQGIVYASFGHWFSSIYVDHVVGALFAGLVLSYLSDKYTTMELLLFIFPIVTISLVKEIGLYFSLAFIGLVFLLEIYNNVLTSNSDMKTLFISKKLIFILITVFLSAVLALSIWGNRLEKIGIKQGGQTISGVVKNIFSEKSILTPEVEKEVQKRFWSVVKFQQLHKEKISLNYNEFSYGTMSRYKETIKLSTLGSMVFFTILSLCIVIFITSKEERTKVSIVLGYTLFITVIYLLILYFSFLVAFGEGALRIPSYVRYMNIGILPMFFILFVVLLPAFSFKNNNKYVFGWLVMVTLLLGLITKPYLKPLYTQLENPVRAEVDLLTANIVQNVSPGSSLFVVFPIKNNGSLNNILSYTLIPLKSKISEFDFETKDFQEMVNIYARYEYIWFSQLNDNLIQKNLPILKGKDKNTPFTLYKVEKSNKNIQFIPII